MITISENVKQGDKVFAWFSPINEKGNKKHPETEYVISDLNDKYFKLASFDGSYSIMFGKELRETWYGNVRCSSVRN